MQDNYAGHAPGGGLPPEQHYSDARRAAGYRAWFESMPTYAGKHDRIYRSLRFGKTMDLFLLDQRRYRDDQPCGDAVAPGCAELNQPRDFLGREQMSWVKRKLSASKAAWKVIGNEVMIMPAKVTGGSYYQFDSWQGYPVEREELLHHIDDKGIDDVVFVTGDIHTFIAGDVRREGDSGQPVALEFVGGSVTSQGLGETDLNAGGGLVIPGNDADPHTDPALITRCAASTRGSTRPTSTTTASASSKALRGEFDVTLKRVLDDQAEVDRDAERRRLPLPRGARAEEHQGRQRLLARRAAPPRSAARP